MLPCRYIIASRRSSPLHWLAWHCYLLFWYPPPLWCGCWRQCWDSGRLWLLSPSAPFSVRLFILTELERLVTEGTVGQSPMLGLVEVDQCCFESRVLLPV